MLFGILNCFLSISEKTEFEDRGTYYKPLLSVFVIYDKFIKVILVYINKTHYRNLTKWYYNFDFMCLVNIGSCLG